MNSELHIIRGNFVAEHHFGPALVIFLFRHEFAKRICLAKEGYPHGFDISGDDEEVIRSCCVNLSSDIRAMRHTPQKRLGYLDTGSYDLVLTMFLCQG